MSSELFRLQDFKKASVRLSEVLQLEKTDITRDSAIKRFELCFDLAWKTIKDYLKEAEGLECRSPKNCFRQAFQVGLLEYNERWLEMTDDRNNIVHLYRQEAADEFYKKLPGYLEMFQELINALEQ